MKLTRTLKYFAAAIFVCFATVAHADVDLTFDGSSVDGWSVTLLNGAPAGAIVPASNVGVGYAGIRFVDETPGSLFYVAPASLLQLDWTGQKLNLAYEIVNPSSPSGTIVPGVADLYVNGVKLAGYDVIDEALIDAVQSVTIDFDNPAFANAGIDVAHISSLLIRAEWWQDELGSPATESFLLSAQPVPEPTTAALMIASLLSTFGYFRKP